jgi:ATP-dependent helicase HrpB
MLRFPVHPRLARMIVEGERQHVGDQAMRLAAMLSDRDIRLESRTKTAADRHRPKPGLLGSSDLVDMLDRFAEAEAVHFEAREMLSLGMDPGATDRARRAYHQLLGLRPGRKRAKPKADDPDSGVRIAVLAAFPDRVAKRRDRGSREFLLAGGGAARLSDASIVHQAPLIVAVDAEARVDSRGLKSGPETLVRLASAVEPEWLAVLFPQRLREEIELSWNERGARVDEVTRTFYDQIALEEHVRPAAPSSEVLEKLIAAVRARGLSCLRDYSGIPELRARLALLAECFPENQIPLPDEAALESILRSICDGKRSIAELADVSLVERFLGTLTPHQRDLLRRHVPERITLGSRRNLRIHYEEGKPPWIESRLQDFFGVRSTPSICAGRIPLTVRLLAPNGRPVQITQDLSGFWHRHYPALRRELQRRYPKHAWPSPDEI